MILWLSASCANRLWKRIVKNGEENGQCDNVLIS